MLKHMLKHSVLTELNKRHSPVFFDTSLFIYLFEDHLRYAPYLENLFDRVTKGNILAMTSVISLSEVLTKPFEVKNVILIKKYREIFLHLPHLSLIHIDDEIAVEAARIRGEYGFHLTDCLQLAAARERGAKSFFTNDKQLTHFKELYVLYLDQFVSEH